MEQYNLFTDGGSRGNPGPAAIGGCVVSLNGEILFTFKEFIGITTNNAAEYKALINGLMLSLDNEIKELSCFLDSELVVKQLNGQYKVKSPDIKILYDEVKTLSRKFSKLSFSHVPRSKNSVADKLVNEALDAELKGYKN